MPIDTVLPLVIGISLLSLCVAWVLARQVLAADTGTPRMREISDAIREGAEAFLSRQYRTIGMLAIVAAAAIFGFYFFNQDVKNIEEMGQGTFWKVTMSFLIGALCSAVAGYIGMFVSIRANIRTATAAMTSLNKALQLALRAGAVSGLAVVSMSLLGVGGLFWLFGGMIDYRHVPLQIVGFGFGASFVALFAQLGGGIYTKAADVGADLVGKVEAGIPEDDPRNPAVIADLVGDNVGDCAGRGADLFESTAAENVGAMILGIALYPVFGLGGILFPLLARAFGLIATIVGVYTVKCREDEDPMNALNRGYFVTTVLAMVGFAAAVYLLLLRSPARRSTAHSGYLLAAGIVGILTAVRLRLDHPVLHRVQVPPGAVDRRGQPHGPGHQHHRRPRGGHGVHRPAGDRDLDRAHGRLQARPAGAAGRPGRGPLRHGGRHDGHARALRVHPGDGHLRPDHRQRRRHHRDVRPARGDPQQDRPPGRRGQHHQGAHQGLRHRLAPPSPPSCCSAPTSTRS